MSKEYSVIWSVSTYVKVTVHYYYVYDIQAFENPVLSAKISSKSALPITYTWTYHGIWRYIIVNKEHMRKLIITKSILSKLITALPLSFYQPLLKQ